MKKSKIKEATQGVIDYFAEYDIILKDFNLEVCANTMGVPITDAEIFLCNLEDKKTMKNIAKGDYSIDIEDESLFNDCYHDMMEDLGYEESDEEE